MSRRGVFEYATKVGRKVSLHAVLGGIPLFALDDDKLNWTADRLRDFGLENFLGVHCTGIQATHRIRGRSVNYAIYVVSTLK